MRLLGSLTIIFLFFSSAKGQAYYTNFREYGSLDGFTAFEGSGKAIKDKKGFLWIGCDNGLYRFDGQNFKNFRHNPADSLSVASDNADHIFIEHDGTFWVCTGAKGISQFNPATQKFHPWRNSNTQEIDITKEEVRKVFQDSQQRIWLVIFGKGLAYLNKKDNSLKVYSFYNGPRDKPKWESTAYINDVKEDRSHQFWIGTHAGLIQFNPETKAFSICRDTMYLKEDVGRNADINAVYVGADGMIWTGMWGSGLKKFDPQKKSWETYYWDLEHLNNSTRNIAHDITARNAHELWVTSFDGLMIFNMLTKQFTKVVSVNSNAAKKINGTRLFDDGSGILWCSGLKTLTKLETKNEAFHFTPVPDSKLYGSGFVVCNTFLKDAVNNLLFIGTYHSKGLYTMNTMTGEVINYPVVKQKVFHENINQVLLDRDKNVWVCFNNGVRLFNLHTKQYQLLSPAIKNASFLNSAVYAALEDDDGSIWFASKERGLLRYDKQLKEIKPFVPGNGQLPADYIQSLFKDSKGNIWLGYHGQSGGIACIRKNRSSIQLYNYANYKIPQADVASISESKTGSIFFTLHIAGLGEITNPLSGKDSFKLYTNNNGLPGNRVLALVKDKAGNLWISTNNGLSIYRTEKKSFQHFSMADGLRENNSESILYCDEKGLIYIGNEGGFQFFDPDFLNRNKEILPVVLHSFRINGKEYDGDINTVNTILLDHEEANFSFEYAALTFTSNDRIKYAYRLKGIDKDWVFADKKRIAAYSIAHGGTYTLQIKATNEQGNWDVNPYELIIEVKPPFWETWWFITLCVLSAGLLVFWITRRRIKMIRAAEERKTHINKIKAESEMKALRAQMNPHFIFNCMNTIDAHIHKNDTEAASEFLHKFSQLIRQVLENSQYPVISIQKDMEALNLYIELEEQRHDFKFTHTIILPEQLLQKGYKIPPLLVQPYVENAILHGLRHKENGAGLLTITFDEKEDQLVCLVEDNGIGRRASAFIYDQRKQNHQSMGLKVSSDRIESLNELYKGISEVVIIDKEDGGGTIVKLIFPKIAESE
ncbi:MAG: two-component regulator propeller domain-containing protein [Ferruginibacter sp.]